ncbi:type II toxin-antitoxin system Phd/YefM family antitoxin [Cryobacterium tagatosivorans]|uniref:Antitoxin n=1 Tax=Cryobacterium tagatosivorans TaxID=1259199 RepID=A0A4R8UC37_9MICO|nr:type II toxin-antitoxin system Phd/YefM family antitoxin [Cryobacterium tagatosivorans]TFB48884.1 type II toxin-antitoxin system Phd/YefM family antitoxin [Cryobacterium tagatosivorans]
MSTIPATEARQKWAQTLERAHREPVTITQHGRDSVVLLDAAVAKRALAALEDAQDAAAADAARAEIDAGEPTIVLDDIARELGIELG